MLAMAQELRVLYCCSDGKHGCISRPTQYSPSFPNALGKDALQHFLLLGNLSKQL